MIFCLASSTYSISEYFCTYAYIEGRSYIRPEATAHPSRFPAHLTLCWPQPAGVRTYVYFYAGNVSF